MNSKQEDILIRIVGYPCMIITVLSIIMLSTMMFASLTYNIMYKKHVYQTVYKVLDTEMVLLKQHSHKGVPLGGGVE